MSLPKVPGSVESRCMSMYATDFAVDLVAPSEEKRESWAAALIDVIEYFQQRLQRSSLKEKIMILGESFSENASIDPESIDVDVSASANPSRMSLALTGLRKRIIPVKKKKKKKAAVSSDDQNKAIAYAISTAVAAESASEGESDTEALLKEKTKYTLEHNGLHFSFRSYAPRIFKKLRELYGIKDEDFASSMAQLKGGGTGDGKSGMLFFSSGDKKYVMKTVKESEKDFFFHGKRGVLKNYFSHLSTNPDTLSLALLRPLQD